MKLIEPKPFDIEAFWAVVGDGRTMRKYSQDHVIFAQGDSADSVFYLQRGQVKIAVVSPRGKEGVIAVLGDGCFFGEGCLAGQEVRIATAVAITDCSVVQMTKEAMARVLHAEPEFSDMLITHLLTRNIRIEEDLIDHLFNSSEKRLARILLLLASYGKEARPEEFVTNISQETLAEMVGTTRSRVSFFLNKFRKLGFIAYNADGMQIHSALLNVVLQE